MIDELLFVVSCCLWGYAVLSSITAGGGPARAAVVAPVIGVLLYLLCSFVLLAIGSYSKTASYLMSLAIASTGLVIVWSRGRSCVTARLKGSFTGFVLSVACLVVVVWLSHQFPAVRVTKDSLGYLLSATVVSEFGSFEHARSIDVLKRLAVISLMHATGAMQALGYSISITPIFGMMTLALLGLAIHEEYRRQNASAWITAVVVILAVGYLVSINRFAYMFFYINGHMMFACFLLAAIVFGAVASRDQSRGFLLLSALAYAVLPWLRVEGVLVGGLFLAMHTTSSELVLRDRLLLVVPFVATGLGWWAHVVPSVTVISHPSLFDPMIGNIAALLALIFFVVVCRNSNLVRRWGPPAILLVLLAALLVLSTIDSGQVVATSFDAMWANMTRLEDWGYFWLIVPVVSLVVFIARHDDSRRWYLYGIVAYMILLLALPVLRDNPYRVGSSDSGNRMLIHVMPLMLLYLCTIAATYLGRSGHVDRVETLSARRVPAA
jgi:hypothetical protein